MSTDKDDFWVPAMVDTNGFYVTRGQLDHFLLRDDGPALVKEFFKSVPGTPNSFSSYVSSCRLYNAIRDIVSIYPKAAEMYWDEDEEEMMFIYPKNGKVHRKIRSIIDSEK